MSDPTSPDPAGPDRDEYGVDLFVPRSAEGRPASASQLSAGGVETQVIPAQPEHDSNGLVHDTPRVLRNRPTGVDRTFQLSTMGVGALVLVITGSIGVFLAYQGIPTFRRYGWGFITHSAFDPNVDQVGILAAVVGTVEIAIISLVAAVPLALATALYITQYAPPRIRSFLTSLVDLMAAIPSLIFGAWGYFVLMPQLGHLARWLSTWLGWIPIFDVPGANPRDPSTTQYHYEQSAFICGVVVAMMVVPLACSIMMNVFGQAPAGEKEAALALGSTRWGMIRAVVLPFGRAGIIGGTMLGLGRALGETIAVLIIFQESFNLKIHVLQTGTITVSALIANNFNDATPSELGALLAAGFVLFLMTLAVNTVAAIVVGRGRSGAGVDI
jgi:phosphate transport system permease protein